MLSDDHNNTTIRDSNNMLLADIDVSLPKAQDTNNAKMNNSHSQMNTTMNFIKCKRLSNSVQRELIKEVDEENQLSQSEGSDDDMECPELSILFPDRVQQIRSNLQDSRVPYLNMKKVRELMMRREEKYRKEIEADNHHVNPTTKIIQLETQLDITRKELTNQMLKFRTMSDDLRSMALHIAEMEKRNEMLVNSNQAVQANYRKMYEDYQRCRSVTNEVERALGKITDCTNMLRVR